MKNIIKEAAKILKRIDKVLEQSSKRIEKNNELLKTWKKQDAEITELITPKN
jgi:hypothetical protein